MTGDYDDGTFLKLWCDCWIGNVGMADGDGVVETS